jgi:hypothetical protein
MKSHSKFINKEKKINNIINNHNFLKVNNTKFNTPINSSSIIINEENLKSNLKMDMNINLNLTIITINKQENKSEFNCNIIFSYLILKF